jgi:hypothetical protein
MPGLNARIRLARPPAWMGFDPLQITGSREFQRREFEPSVAHQ